MMADTAELQNAMRNAFKGLRMDYKISHPQFYGMKGEKPKDHWLKVEDWLAHFYVAKDDKIDRFKETLFG